MKLSLVITALLSAVSLTSSQFTYIFEVQDENRAPKSELFGDLSQFKFVPPSQLPRNPVPRSPVPAQPQPAPQPSRREDNFEEEPPRRNRLSGAAQNQRQFVVRAPQPDSREQELRNQFNNQPAAVRLAPQSQPIQYQAQPQTALAVAQPAPQNFPQLAPHQTAHLNPVLRTIVPRNQEQPPPTVSQVDPNFELLQNFVRSQSQPNDGRPTALQTLGQSQRFVSQPQPQPQPSTTTTATTTTTIHSQSCFSATIWHISRCNLRPNRIRSAHFANHKPRQFD